MVEAERGRAIDAPPPLLEALLTLARDGGSIIIITGEGGGGCAAHMRNHREVCVLADIINIGPLSHACMRNVDQPFLQRHRLLSRALEKQNDCCLGAWAEIITW